jgi:hypothetical protein
LAKIILDMAMVDWRDVLEHQRILVSHIWREINSRTTGKINSQNT